MSDSEKYDIRDIIALVRGSKIFIGFGSFLYTPRVVIFDGVQKNCNYTFLVGGNDFVVTAYSILDKYGFPRKWQDTYLSLKCELRASFRDSDFQSTSLSAIGALKPLLISEMKFNQAFKSNQTNKEKE